MSVFEGRDDKRYVTEPGGPSMTKQAPAEDTDLNAIMRKYLATGLLPHYERREPRYGDFSNVGDFLTAQLRVRAVEQLFAELPAEVRDACNHDPAELLRMVMDASRRAELVKLGLVPPGEEPTEAQLAAAGVGDPGEPGEPPQPGSGAIKPQV